MNLVLDNSEDMRWLHAVNRAAAYHEPDPVRQAPPLSNSGSEMKTSTNKSETPWYTNLSGLSK